MTLIATRPQAGEARPYAFPALRRETVAGGTVVAAHLPGQLLASAMLLLDAGGARESDGREGTATVLAKSLEEGTRQRDSADERQVFVSLTDSGRRLREKGLGMNLVKASGLTPEEFHKMQKAVVTLRDNLIKAARRKK